MLPYWVPLNLPPLEKDYTPQDFEISYKKYINLNITDRIDSLIKDNKAIELLYQYYPFKAATVYYKSELTFLGGAHKDSHYLNGIKHITSSSVNIVLMGGAGLSFLDIPESEFNYSTKFLPDNPNSPGLEKYYDSNYRELDIWNGKGWALINPSFCHLVNHTDIPRMAICFRNREITWDQAVRSMQTILGDSSFIYSPYTEANLLIQS